MKKLMFLVLSMCFCYAAKAQIRHVKGMKGMEGYYLQSKEGSAFKFGFSNYLSNKAYWKISVGREKGEYGSSDFNTYMLLADYNRTVYVFKEIVYANLVGGASIIRDNADGEAFDDYKVMQYGVNLGAEIEGYINDRIIILLGFNQILDLSEDFGQGRYFYGAGLKLSF